MLHVIDTPINRTPLLTGVGLARDPDSGYRAEAGGTGGDSLVGEGGCGPDAPTERPGCREHPPSLASGGVDWTTPVCNGNLFFPFFPPTTFPSQGRSSRPSSVPAMCAFPLEPRRCQRDARQLPTADHWAQVRPDRFQPHAEPDVDAAAPTTSELIRIRRRRRRWWGYIAMSAAGGRCRCRRRGRVDGAGAGVAGHGKGGDLADPVRLFDSTRGERRGLV